MTADRTEIAAREDSLWLDILLDLRRSPVGIRFLATADDYAASPFPEFDTAPPYCRIVRDAGLGQSRKFTAAHLTCVAAGRALGLAKPDEDALSGTRYRRMGVYENLGVSRQVIKNMVYCAHSPYGVEAAPLHAFLESDPDVVILVTTPYNAMRILQGNAYHRGHLKQIKMAGMQAICEECTSYPYESGEINVSMMCSGTRFAAKWGKDELGVGIPFQLLAQVIDGLKKTATHMDRDSEKAQIEEKMTHYGVIDRPKLVYGKNYYTRAFQRIGRAV